MAGTFLIKAAGFLGSIVLARIMTKDAYGQLAFVENRYTYAYLLAGLGLNNAVFRYMVLAENPEERKSVFGFVTSRGTLINIAVVLVSCLVFNLMPASGVFSEASSLLPLMLLALPFQYLFDTCTFSLRALFRNRLYAIAAVGAACLIWGSKIVGVWVAGLPGSVLSWPATYVVMAAILLIYFHIHDFQGVQKAPLGHDKGREMSLYALQYMVTNGLWAAFHQNDLLLMGILAGESTALADFKVAYTIPAALSILSSSIGMFVAPYFVKNENNTEWIWRSWLKVIGASLAIVGSVSIGIAVLAPSVITLVYGQQYVNVATLMYILLLSSLLNNALRYPTANILAAMGSIRVNMVVSACGLALQIVLNLLLIPRFGAYGAAWCSLLTYGVMTGFVITYFFKEYKA